MGSLPSGIPFTPGRQDLDLGKLSNISKVQFSYLQNGDETIIHTSGDWKDQVPGSWASLGPGTKQILRQWQILSLRCSSPVE